MTSLPRCAILALAIALFTTELSGTEILYVDGAATGAADGTSWGNAYPELADALIAAVPGDQIWVAAGTYTPDPGGSNRALSFSLVDGVGVYGGFLGGEGCLSARDPILHATILSGDLAGNDAPLDGCDPAPDFSGNAENSWHVVRAEGVGPGAVLDGFTVVGGNADGPGDDRNGGGIWIRNASPQVRHCTVLRNSTVAGGAPPLGNGGDGAGIWCSNSAATIRDTLVCSNRTGDGLGSDAIPGRGGRGGGIAVFASTGVTISGCRVERNRTGRGAVTDLLPPSGPGLHGGGDGGGISIVGSNGVRIEHGTIVENRCGAGGFNVSTGEGGRGGSGGGIAASGSELAIADTVFSQNESGRAIGVNSALPSGDGGGLHLAACVFRLERCTLDANRTSDGCAGCGVDGGSGRGGALHATGSLAALVSECVFIDNETGANQREFVGDESGDGGAIASSGGPLVIANSTFVGNRTGFGGTGEDGRDSGSGGAIWLEGDAEFEISGCVLAGNATGDSGPPDLPGIGFGTVGVGGAIGCALSGAGTLVVASSTIVDNRTGALIGAGIPGAGGGVAAAGNACVYGSILWGNADATGAGQLAQTTAACAEFSCIEDFTTGSATNFGADPLLLDAVGPVYDLRVAAGSPCIDSASAALLPVDRADLDGDGDLLETAPWDLGRGPRIAAGSLPDVGAHELRATRFAATIVEEYAEFVPVTGEGTVVLRVQLAEDPTNPGFPHGVTALDLRLAFDPALLQVVSAAPGGAVVGLGGGEGPESYDVETCPGVVTVSSVLTTSGPGLIALVPREVLVVEFATTPALLALGPGTTTEVRVADGLDCGGVPPELAGLVTLVAGSVPLEAGVAALRLVPGVADALFIRGDCNADGDFDLADALWALGALFPVAGVLNSLACRDACDANDDGLLNIADPISLLDTLFLGGAPPPPPVAACGADPTPDGHCCREFSPCP